MKSFWKAISFFTNLFKKKINLETDVVYNGPFSYPKEVIFQVKKLFPMVLANFFQNIFMKTQISGVK